MAASFRVLVGKKRCGGDDFKPLRHRAVMVVMRQGSMVVYQLTVYIMLEQA